MSQNMVPPPDKPHRAGDSPGSDGPLYSARATTLFRVALVGVVLLLTGSGFMASAYYHSGYWNRIGFAPQQPVQVSHRHHAGELRIDCRFCHASVETSAFAGMPATETRVSLSTMFGWGIAKRAAAQEPSDTPNSDARRSPTAVMKFSRCSI